jgi:hypothetical protein
MANRLLARVATGHAAAAQPRNLLIAVGNLSVTNEGCIGPRQDADFAPDDEVA